MRWGGAFLGEVGPASMWRKGKRGQRSFTEAEVGWIFFLGNLDQSRGRTEKMIDWTSFVLKGALFLFRD